MSILLLGLLGLFGAAILFDGDDEPTPDDIATGEDPAPEEDIVEMLRLDEDTVIATQGDDVITRESFDELEGYSELPFGITQLDLLGGDDSLDEYALQDDEVTVNAGEGNDTIELDRFTYVNGGEGNDSISGQGAVMNGDAGNDTITTDIGEGLPNSRPTLLGGAGDDMLQVTHTLGEDNTYDNGVAVMNGGEGNDAFVVELIDGVGPTLDAQGEPVTLTSDVAAVSIEDFVAGEDSLTIDISSFTEGGTYELVDVEFAESTRPSSGPEETTRYRITLSLLEQGETEPFLAFVGFQSTGGPVTLDDIAILGAAAA